MNSTGFSVLAGMFPFVFFFLWWAFILMNPQHDAPKVPTYKILLVLAVIVPLCICMLLFLLAPPSAAVPTKATAAAPPVIVVPPAPKVRAPLALPKRSEPGT
jgi:hypothetical protein